MTDVQITVVLNAQAVDAGELADTISDLKTALEEVESSVTSDRPKVQWRWDEEAAVTIAASPNGVPLETLEKIVGEVDRGFRGIKEAKGRAVEWPANVGERAQTSLLRIVRRLDTVDTITVRIPGKEAIEIDSAVIPGTEVGHRTYLERSELEGLIETISTRGGALHFSLRENNSGRSIQCYFNPPELSSVKEYFGQSVVAEGEVRYRADGSPTSMLADSVRPLPEPRWTLEELIGKIPDLTGGVPAADYVRNIRGGESERDR